MCHQFRNISTGISALQRLQPALTIAPRVQKSLLESPSFCIGTVVTLTLHPSDNTRPACERAQLTAQHIGDVFLALRLHYLETVES